MYVTIAIRNLLQAPRRTALVATALAVVSMMLVLLMTLTEGLSDTMFTSSTLLSSGHVNVAGFYKPKPTSWAPMVTQRKNVRDIVEASTPGLDYVIDRSRGWAKIVSETESLQAGLVGLDVAQESRLLKHLRLAPQRAYHEGSTSSHPHAAADLHKLSRDDGLVLFAGQAKRLEVDVGDVVTVASETASGQTNTAQGYVAAVVQDVGLLSNFSVFVNRMIVRNLYRQNDDVTGNVMVYLRDPTQASQVLGVLTDVLKHRGFALMEHQAQPFFQKFETVAAEDWTGQKLDLTTWEDELGALKWPLEAIRSVSFFLVGVLTAMVVVGISNSTLMAVRERTQEIGTLRAIGMGRSRVLLLFLTEAFILGAGATGLGATVGAAIAACINLTHINITHEALKFILMSDTVHLTVRLAQVTMATAGFTMVTALAALWPALRAARLQPVTAIHHIG